MASDFTSWLSGVVRKQTLNLEAINYRQQTAYHLAVESGNTDLVGYLAEQGSVVAACDLHGNNALHMACTSLGSDRSSNSYYCYNTLTLNSDDNFLENARSEASSGEVSNEISSNELCENGNDSTTFKTYEDSSSVREMVAMLLKHGVSVFQKNRIGFTPVRLAALMGKEACARLMLAKALQSKHYDNSTGVAENGESVGNSNDKSVNLLRQLGLLPLEAAIAEKNMTRLRTLLCRDGHSSTARAKEGCIKDQDEMEWIDGMGDGVTSMDESLHMVVLNPQLNPMLKLLLGSSVAQRCLNGNSSLGFTPLYCACANRNSDAVEMLLSAGADPDKPSQRQYVRPLKKSILLNDLGTIRQLLLHGASACHCTRCVGTGVTGVCGSFSAAASGLAKGHCSSSPPVTLVGIRDYETDLLHLALFTDWSISRTLIAAGTCVSDKAEAIFASSLTRDVSNNAGYSSLLYSLYEAGWTVAVRRILLHRSNSDSSANPPSLDFHSLESTPLSQLDHGIQNTEGNERRSSNISPVVVRSGNDKTHRTDRDPLFELKLTLQSPDSLRQACRSALRRMLRPRIFWAVQRLPLPDIVKRYLVLECC